MLCSGLLKQKQSELKMEEVETAFRLLFKPTPMTKPPFRTQLPTLSVGTRRRSGKADTKASRLTQPPERDLNAEPPIYPGA